MFESDNNQRGGGRGIIEDNGGQGTCMKDTWTKPKGEGFEGGGAWGAGAWWGENGDNCTCTTLKIKN